jgi:hypothetical protein
MEEGESKEKDCGRMRTFGLGVRGGTVRKVAMMGAMWCTSSQ